MLKERERKAAAERAKGYPRGKGDLFLASHENSWDSNVAAEVLNEYPHLSLVGCPATAVAAMRGDTSREGLLKALDDICKALELGREDYCEVLDKRPRDVSRLLGISFLSTSNGRQRRK